MSKNGIGAGRPHEVATFTLLNNYNYNYFYYHYYVFRSG